ncbi:unnamed protein product [Kuraishia capsulata CBS 1993]|uniref:IPT/TIG domain-containing protein n=1 Tax=Kuraishia capsulata CBS 1993 TaxID=1382522 RepID=W6MSA4_9ASCO|nr:uncharacterized protein KUCA_T00004068001 [Kuraishia capsulata CBS 1993]CDK28087.1 unnamed protein product [Kuraishia capsulata CBS 1993]
MTNVQAFDGIFPEQLAPSNVKEEDELLDEFLDSRFYESLSQNVQSGEGDGVFDTFPAPQTENDMFGSVKGEYPFNSYIEDDAMLGIPGEEDDINSSNSGINQHEEPITPEISHPGFDLLQVFKNDDSNEQEYNENRKANTVDRGGMQSEEFALYEQSRNELMKLKFGATKPNSLSPENGLDFASELTASIPPEYFAVDEESLPYQLNISDFPSYSRVETQIKLRLTVSPAPPQFLIHLPSDTIAKSKLCLSAPVPESMQPHLLYLDTYVTSSGATYEGMTPDSTAGTPDYVPQGLKGCNACVRCLRREMKRAGRRKTGNIEDGLNWSVSEPKRAVIFNCKEIISFPRPTGYEASDVPSEKSIEIMSRIICYCRHHSEPDGFRLLFVLKNYKGEVLGRTFSNSVMIMDRKKAVGSKGSTNVSDKQYNSSSGKDKFASKQATESRPLSPTSIDESSTSEMPQSNGMVRPSKRQKRPWSPESTGTYYDSVSQQRAIRNDSVSSSGANTSVSRKEPISPTSSDALSPHLQFSSSTSVFTTTPDRSTSVTGLSSASFASKQRRQVSTSVPQSVQQSTATDAPAIQRIIPAQGPIRGGIEVTLLGCNFRPGLTVKFGANMALATHCWSESTMVTYLPPASQAGQVLVTFSEENEDGTRADVLEEAEDTSSLDRELALSGATPQQIFTYLDDTDRQLIELALQIVGLKMNGKLEDAKNIAKRIIGNSNSANSSPVSTTAADAGGSVAPQESVNDEWLEQATTAVQKLSQSNLGEEEVLLKFLALIDLPNSPVATPNWAICTTEGQTLLHLASMKGYYQLVLFLINRGSRVDYRDGNDLTPLHLALLNGQREIIKVLIKCKAKLTTKLSPHVTIRDIADSNVLDLLGYYCPVSENETEDSEDRQFRELNRRMSNDSVGSLFSSENDNGMRWHVSRMIQDAENRSASGRESDLDSEVSVDPYDEDGYDDDSEFADEENNLSDYSSDDVSVTEEASPSPMNATVEDFKPQPVNKIAMSSRLWKTMTKAFKQPASQGDQEVDEEVEEDLPTYDDLFPQGASFKSLFGGAPKTEDTVSMEGLSELVSSETLDSSIEDASKDDMIYNLLSTSARKPVSTDKRLLFFWFPLLLALMVLVLANKFNMVNEEYWESTIVAEFLRSAMGKFVYGKERFEEMFADRFNSLPIV